MKVKTKTIKPKNCRDCHYNCSSTCVCLNSAIVGKHISIFGQKACKYFKERNK